MFQHHLFSSVLAVATYRKIRSTYQEEEPFPAQGWLQTWMYRVILLSIGITVPTFKSATGWLNNFYTHFWQYTLHYTYLALSARDEAIYNYYDNNMYTATTAMMPKNGNGW